MREFQDRAEAGRLLAAQLTTYEKAPQTWVLGLARGGVVVAAAVASQLSLPLNVVVPRKIGAPDNPELALGSIMEDGEGVFNESLIRALQVSQAYLQKAIIEEKRRARERLALYRRHAALPDIKDQTVILVDDGMATGSTMLASIQAMRRAGAKRVIVAVPVASTSAMQLVRKVADEVISLLTRDDFIAVGLYYRSFAQTENEEVVALLQERAIRPFDERTKTEEQIRIRLGKIVLFGDLHVPAKAKGLVIFAHGSGSSRHSRRNRAVAGILQQQGLATLLFDLLTEEEEKIDQQTALLRFNIPLLAERLMEVTRWMHAEKKDLLGQSLPIGYFGASTGAAAALIASAQLHNTIRAVVSRGGRPDLADTSLERVMAPTLLIVGGEDHGVIELNEAAFSRLTCVKQLEIVPHATHLFEEPGALEQVARLATNWFLTHLTASQ